MCFFFQPLAVLVCASVGILWACYPLLTIQVYSGDAKVWNGIVSKMKQYIWTGQYIFYMD